MEKIAIMTDVNAGLDYIGYDPEIITLRSIINFGDEHYIDGVEIKADEFYERIYKEKRIPSTSAPTIGNAMEELNKLVSEGYTDVIMYSISYKMSSIGQMVETLIPEYEGKIKIHVVNTKTSAFNQGYMALEAKKMVDEGKTVNEILERTEYLINNNNTYFVVDNLMYLVRNGRLSGAKGFVGTIIKIKPILNINKEGEIVTFEKIKSHKKAVERAIELVSTDLDKCKDAKLFIYHTLREDDGKNLCKYFEEKYPQFGKVELKVVTPAVGAHIGYGVLGFSYFMLEKK